MHLKSLLKLNWKSALTVALVSVPLSISLAIASGAAPTVGILTAVYAGAVAAIFGSSNYNVVGPAGALSGILMAFSLANDPNLLPVVAMLSGVFIVILKLIKIEKYLVFIPESTVFGFTLGVALSIALGQLNFALGLKNLQKHQHFLENLKETLAHAYNLNPVSLILTISFILIMIFFMHKLPKIPGAIVVAVVGIFVGIASKNGFLPFAVDTLSDYYPSLVASIFVPYKFTVTYAVFSTAVTVAVISILETMISARIADGITKSTHKKEKEIFGLGIANIVSGLVGALPATAVFARTSINIKTGATHRISSLMNAVFVFIIYFFLLPFFKFIPMSAIAAILIFAAVRMVETYKLVKFYKIDKRSLTIGFIVAIVSLIEDPVLGILLGSVISLAIFAEKMSRGHFEATIKDTNGEVLKIRNVEEKVDSKNLVYTIKGPLSYINSISHLERFNLGLNGYENIFIRLKECTFIDTDGAETLDSIIESIQNNKKNVFIILDNQTINEQLNLLTHNAKSLKVFKTTSDAIANMN